MGTQYKSINKKIEEFILEQKIFFVATATEDSFINLSPKGMNSLKIINIEYFTTAKLESKVCHLF